MIPVLGSASLNNPQCDVGKSCYLSTGNYRDGG